MGLLGGGSQAGGVAYAAHVGGFVAGLILVKLFAAGRLVRVLDDWCAPYQGYYLYYPSRRQSSRALAVVIEALRHRE